MPSAPLAAALGALAGLALGLAFGASLARPPAPPLPAAGPPAASVAPSPVSPPASASASSPAAPAGSPGEPPGESSGELTALRRLEQADEQERTIDEAERIARGHLELARRDLAALAAHVERDPSLAHDRATLARFAQFIERDRVDVEALTALARMPGPESMDLLYFTWRRHQHTPAGLLARDLVRRREASERSSPALRALVAIERAIDEQPAREGQAARRCQRLRELLEAEALSDRRCIPLLNELEGRRGCGGDGQADCYPCLREGGQLEAAAARCKKREAPAPWVLSRR